MQHDPDHEPVGQAVNYILSALDIIAAMALKAETYDEVAAEEIALGQIISRAELILSFLDTYKPAKFRSFRPKPPFRVRPFLIWQREELT